MIKQFCNARDEHKADTLATHQLSVYGRAPVVLIWRGLCCPECLETAMKELKKHPVGREGGVILVWKLDRKAEAA